MSQDQLSFSSILASLDISPQDYLIKFVVPIISFGVVLSVLMLVLLPDVFTGGARLICYFLPLFCLLFAISYPKMRLDAKKVQIEQNLHYFITHMGVLATSDMPLNQVFETIGQKKQYMALADEIKKIFNLINSWHLSTPEACRFIAKRSPSKIFSDFLERFSHGLESGEDPEEFLMIEQDVVMRDYEVLFKGAMAKVANLQEMFMSLVMSLLFMGSMGIIMPLITGSSPIGIVGMTVFLFIFIEIMMIFVMRSRAPKDTLWQTIETTSSQKKLISMYPMIIIACVIIGIFSFILFYNTQEPQIILGIAITPLAIPGFLFGRREKSIKRGDENYPSYIRSLGASATTRGGIVEYALKELRLHDFGALTQPVRNLYTRLTLGIDKMKSWNHFSLETGSNLILRCNEMFVESLDVGGKPDKIGNIISDNFIHITSLRKLRYDAASGVTGTLYGLMGGMSATLYLSLAVVYVMQQTLEAIDLPVGSIAGLLTGEFNFLAVKILLMSLLLGHSLLSSLLIRVIDGGSLYTAPVHMVGMYWTGAITSIVTTNAMVDFIGGGSGLVEV